MIKKFLITVSVLFALNIMPANAAEGLHLRIPSIKVDAVAEQAQWVWVDQEAGVGRWLTSADGVAYHPQAGDHLVFSGHNYAAFKYLWLVRIGNLVYVNDQKYIVKEKYYLREGDQDQEQRNANAARVLEHDDGRVTLITCAGPNDVYRLVVVAYAAG